MSKKIQFYTKSIRFIPFFLSSGEQSGGKGEKRKAGKAAGKPKKQGENNGKGRWHIICNLGW